MGSACKRKLAQPIFSIVFDTNTAMNRICLTSLFILFFSLSFAQQINPLLVENDAANQERWVDSVYGTLSLQEKMGQLFMIDVYSKDSRARTEKVKGLIRDYHIGGLIFSKGGPVRQARMNNELQETAKIPLLIGMDAEWGLAMRLDSTFAYPWNMTLGAIKNNETVEKIGHRIGVHCKRLGVHFNFAPVVDINTNPKNPIIGNRSFGEDRELVTQKSLAFMKGMQSAGVLANAKHFPGHGDTDADSHKTLPTLLFDKERIDSLELYPYKKIIGEGLSSVMVAHLNIPSLISEKGYPSSISKDVVTDLLIGKLGFNGLIFTDALSMKGASNFKEPGEIDLAAFLAGNDVLLISNDVPKAHTLLVNAYREGVITEERLERSVKKILMAKYKVGLNNFQPISEENLLEDLNTPEDKALYDQAMEEAITLIQNKEQLLPIRKLEDTKIAYMNLGDASGAIFHEYLNKYAKVDWVKGSSLQEYQSKLKPYDYVIIGFHKSNENPWKGYKFSSTERTMILEIAKTKKVILDVFTRPYALLDLSSKENLEGIVLSYQNSEASQRISAQLIFGAIGAQGQLPVSIGADFPVGTSITTTAIKRLGYTIPERVDMDSEKLKKVDSLMQHGFYSGMFPGAQVVVARKGKVIYNHVVGYQTQKKNRSVTDTTLYDLASLTKILATLPLVMQLYDEGKLTMDTRLDEMLPEFKGSNKGHVTVKQMLSHYARLKAWIPFYYETLDKETSSPSYDYYRRQKEEGFTTPVADHLFMRNDYKDTIYKIIRESDLRRRIGYKYSDLPYYLMKKFIERSYKRSQENLVQEKVYRSLGAHFTTYNPLKRFPIEQISPTEEDNSFRMQKIHGYVHDQGAAMLGGVGGHAGLFSTANDVAKIMQMYLWKGFYGGVRYFSPDTFDAFNTCYYCSKDVRRGVGFDKPQLGKVGPTCGCVSMTSFGHSGFTGTFTWADPEEEIVYVFLSNRTYPDVDNRMLISSDLRSDIQEAIYKAIKR